MEKIKLESVIDKANELLGAANLDCDVELFLEDGFDNEFFDDGNWHVVRNGIRFCFGFGQEKFPMDIPAKLQLRCNAIADRVTLWIEHRNMFEEKVEEKESN